MGGSSKMPSNRVTTVFRCVCGCGEVEVVEHNLFSPARSRYCGECGQLMESHTTNTPDKMDA